MCIATFDTLAFSEEIENSGMPKEQVKAITCALAKAFQSANIPTRTEIKELETSIKASETSVIKWVVGAMVAQTGLLFTIIKFFVV